MAEKTCVIIGAGTLESKPEIPAGSYIIAADGGYAHLLRYSIKPDLVMGDFDSLGYVPEGVAVERHPVMKDDTDTMLAVRTALKNGFRRIVIYGGTGGRPDHTVANLQTLNYIASHGGRGYLSGGGYTYVCVRNGSIAFSESASGSVSVFSLTPESRGVSETGLLYTLDSAVLRFDSPIGVSNSFTGARAVISVTDGVLLIAWQGGISVLDE